jgi:hypothetical protein
MKRAAAIVLSLILILSQAMASAQPGEASAEKSPARCCGCKSHCCVAQSFPNPQPFPVAPASASAQNDFTAFIQSRPAWILPANVPSHIFSSASAPSPATAVPLFTRHCVFLI